MKKSLLSIVFIVVHAAGNCIGQDVQGERKSITEFDEGYESVVNKRFISGKADSVIFFRAFLNEVAFVDCEFNNVNFDEAKIENSLFEKGSLKDVRFTWANLYKAMFSSAHFDDVHFVSCNIHDSTFNDISANKLYLVQTGVNNSSFNNAQIAGLQTINARITDTSFNGANLAGSSFGGATLVNVTFENAVLDNVDFTNAHLKDIDFSKVKSARDAIFNNIELENVILPINEEAKKLAQDPLTRQLYWSAQCSMLKNEVAKANCMAAVEVEAQSEELISLKQKLHVLEKEFSDLLTKNTICENSLSEITVLLRETRDYFRQMEAFKASAPVLGDKLSRIN